MRYSFSFEIKYKLKMTLSEKWEHHSVFSHSWIVGKNIKKQKEEIVNLHKHRLLEHLHHGEWVGDNFYPKYSELVVEQVKEILFEAKPFLHDKIKI